MSSTRSKRSQTLTYTERLDRFLEMQRDFSQGRPSRFAEGDKPKIRASGAPPTAGERREMLKQKIQTQSDLDAAIRALDQVNPAKLRDLKADLLWAARLKGLSVPWQPTPPAATATNNADGWASWWRQAPSSSDGPLARTTEPTTTFLSEGGKLYNRHAGHLFSAGVIRRDFIRTFAEATPANRRAMREALKGAPIG